MAVRFDTHSHWGLRIIHTLHTSNIYYDELDLFVTFPKTDLAGNTSEEIVRKITFAKSKIDTINWSNFYTDNILRLKEPPGKRTWRNTITFSSEIKKR